MDHDVFVITPEVQGALNDRRAVVALESTVIAHGLPQPLNFEIALELEQIVRDAGAIPATIGVVEGRLFVGLDEGQIRLMARQDGIHKLSRRDLPIAVAQKWNGATTVATTMWIAHQAGIEVFATGGIGGVHRGALPDVSADLPELERLPMVVVCAGAKIVLDLPATREWLETHGVTVIGYKCDDMPAFYSRKSGLPIDARADFAQDVAGIFVARKRLNLAGSVLLTVPVPKEFEVPDQELESILSHALLEAEKHDIRGKEITPFLLSRMSERSNGATLKANLALLRQNARVASEVAASLRNHR
ncbi:MAG TPA: pseudouridine-5'-phosphate glycosidase [Terriglobia bacterium]|nr:pseudouridine-5'-phosphate glycosidase [Terriglobia bacterium]